MTMPHGNAAGGRSGQNPVWPASEPAGAAGTRSAATVASPVPGRASDREQGPGRRRAPGLADVLLSCADIAALAAAVATARAGPLASVMFATVVLLLARVGRQSRLRLTPSASAQAGGLAATAVLGAAAALASASVTGIPLAAAEFRSVLGLAALAWSLLLLGRVMVAAGVRAAHRAGLATTRAVIVGSGPLASAVARELATRPELGLVPVGIVSASTDLPPDLRDRRAQHLPPVLGSIGDLDQVIAQHRIGHVIGCPDVHPGRPGAGDQLHVIEALRARPREVAVISLAVPRFDAIPPSCLDWIGAIPVVRLRRTDRPGTASLLCKRLLDVVAGAALLAVASPVLLLLFVAILATAGRPVIFRQVRVTGRGRQAVIYKLRTLGWSADSDSAWSVRAHQPTPLGPWLRRWHLDELPQLANVVLGQMSLVGPRPERPYFAEMFSGEIPGYRARHRMPAGLTGWAQVHGWHGDTSIAERTWFDNFYIETWSPQLDFAILARTAWPRQAGRGAR